MFRASGELVPLYQAMPRILLEAPSVVLPPGLAWVFVQTLVLFFLACLAEACFRWRYRGLSFAASFRRVLETDWPLYALFVFGACFFPGVGVLPMTGWFLLFDGRSWVASVVLLAVVVEKVAPGVSLWPGRHPRAVLFAAALLALALSTPNRLLTQPYDARFGTGDEPRYIRIAASLLHDGDADVRNAEQTRLEQVSAAGVARSLFRILGSPFRALVELRDPSSPSRARSLGGQVIEGRDGGYYYVYLPGFPLLLTPAMALDSILWPARRMLTLFTCLIIAAALAVALARLLESELGRSQACLLAFGLTVAMPIAVHSFQVYPELTAALAVAVMLRAVLFAPLTPASALVFGAFSALLPWLHTRYYPLWAVLLLAFGFRALRIERDGKAWAVGTSLPVLFVLLQCLYMLRITGSAAPDALWVLNGKERLAALVGSDTLAGLHFILLDRMDGFLVYAPFYAFALAGLVALRNRPFTFWVCCGLVVPYLLAAGSHDRGGEGGWSPPGRYVLPVVPVLALAIAVWIGKKSFQSVRAITLVLAVVASVTIVLAMLSERHFPYDRLAFLASAVVDPSPALGWGYPILLVSVLALVAFWSHRGWPASLLSVATAIVVLALVAGSLSSFGVESTSWIHRKGRWVRARPEIEVVVVANPCPKTGPSLVFEGGGGRHALLVRGSGFERQLVVPGAGETSLPIEGHPFLRFTDGGSQRLFVIHLRLAAGQDPLRVRSGC